MHLEFVVFRKGDSKSLGFLAFVDVIILSILNSSTVRHYNTGFCVHWTWYPLPWLADRRLQIGASDPLDGFHGQNYSIHKLSFHPWPRLQRWMIYNRFPSNTLHRNLFLFLLQRSWKYVLGDYIPSWQT